jgi:hypothetical protein
MDSQRCSEEPLRKEQRLERNDITGASKQQAVYSFFMVARMRIF